jgi:Kef-type K+ transport system membrane component KefB
MAFAGVLTLAAVAGKQLCSLGVLERGADRLAVGLGMIPRGEVGLIFAGIGSGLMLSGQPVVDPGVFSAVVVMVVLTTLCTPPLLAWRLGRRNAPSASSRS